MSAFSRAAQTNKSGVRTHISPAPKKLTIEPTHFAASWHLRPTERVEIGLRVPPERDFEGAAVEARKSVDGRSIDEQGQPEAFERAYARILVARAVCDPDNVNAPHPNLPLPDDQIARAFPPATIHWLFDEVDRLHVEQSPGYTEASDDDLRSLSDLLSTDDPLGGLSLLRANRVRRYIDLILTEIEA